MNRVGDTKARFGMKYLKERWTLGVVLQKRPLEAVPGFSTAPQSVWVWENVITSRNLGLQLYGT